MATASVRPETTVRVGPVPLVQPDTVIRSEGFETGFGGWIGSGAARFNTGSHSGTWHLGMESAEPMGMVEGQLPLTGLVVGGVYTFSFWLRSMLAETWTYITSDWDGDHGVYFGTAGDWVKITYEYTATATTGFIAVQGGTAINDLTDLRVDDFTITRHAWLDDEGDAALTITGGRVTLDENYAPYAQAQIDVPLTDLFLLEQIDPRNEQRVVITATEAVGGSTREFDLGLRSREVNHKTGSLTLELASDEAKLIDTKRLATTVDKTARDHEGSLRAVCQWALDKIGATLEAGSTDADVTARWTATNEFTNPAPSSATGFTAGTGTSSILYGNGFGVTAMRWTASGTGPAYLNIASAFSVRPGYLYTVAGEFASSVSRAVGFMLRWYDGNGATIRDQTLSTVTTNASTLTRSLNTVQAPPTAAKVDVFAVSQVNTAGQNHWVSQLMWSEGVQSIDYFSGATPDADGYLYEWEGTASASVSSRTPADGIERLPELFNWSPGQALNDFLRPLLEASGFRLFCDEHRVWRLIDPAAYEVPGYVVVQSGYNATEGTDSISRNTDEWADGVVVIYRWSGANGNTQESYDVAGTPGKVLTVEREREYPGPGAAAYILNSLQGRGRTQDVTALVNYTTTPGQDVTISLPGTLSQTGKVRRVEFGLSGGLMTLGTRGLTDALPGSWATWPPDETWSEVEPTLAWKDA